MVGAVLCLGQAARAEDIAIVRGARASPSRDGSVASSVVTDEQLRAPGLEAAEVLRAQPGVRVVESGGYGALSTASVRGATAAQTPVYLAGIRLNDDVGGTADLSLVPLWLIQRVEIYRGNAPVDADQLGIGGAIFFEPQRPRGSGGAAGALVGSFGARAGWAHAAVGDERAAALLGVRRESAANDYAFLNDGGTRFDARNQRTEVRSNADAATWDVWALGRARLGESANPASVDVLFNTVAREQGLPGLSLLPTTRARAHLRRQLAGLRATVPCAAEGRCVITSTTSALVSRAAYDDPLAEVGLGTSRSDLRGDRVEEAVSVRVDATSLLTFTAVVRAASERLFVDDRGATALEARRASAQGSLLAAFELHPLVTARALGNALCNGTHVASTGARGPGFVVGGAAATVPGAGLCDTVVPAARLGLEIGRGDVVVLANAGRYARLPTLGELYGTSGVVRGNPELRREAGVAADMGVRVVLGGPRRPRMTLDVFAFGREASDLVSYVRSSLGYVLPFNVGRARVLGLEALAVAEPLAFASVSFAATLTDPRDRSPARTTTNDLLPYQSRLVLASRLEVHGGGVLGSRRLGVTRTSAAVAYRHEASRYADAAGLVVLPPQGSLDLEGAIETAHLALRARVANLLDQTRFDLVGYPLPGRAAYLALEVMW